MSKKSPRRTPRNRINVAAEQQKFKRIAKIIRQFGAELRKFPGVVSIRPGYRFRDGWFAQPVQQVIVVSVVEKGALSSLRGKTLPRTFHGIDVDVKPATPLEQVKHMGEASALVASLDRLTDAAAGDDLAFPGWQYMPMVGSPAALTAAAAGLLPYKPPPDVKLNAVTDAMSVTCCASPEEGFLQLAPFLRGVKNRFTVAMYDFTAPHVRNSMTQAMKKAKGDLRLILDPKVALPNARQRNTSNKKNDVKEEKVKLTLKQAIGKRLKFEWAAVTSKDKVTRGIFPSAYHTKVAVRDGKAFWLSSGNWQSSNQPDVAKLMLPVANLQQKYNREWHVIIEHTGLSTLYETFIEWDMKQAAPLQVEPAQLAQPTLAIPPNLALTAALAAKTYKATPSKTFTFSNSKKLKVQPLLTPDNYADFATRLIQSAKKSVYFQNQYIKIPKQSTPQFDKAVNALLAKQNAGLDVKIILRNEGDVRSMLEALRNKGFSEDNVKMQSNCHNKGIVVDSKVVLVGSHNWSSQGVTRNRDASLIFYDEGIAQYFEGIFLYDWETLAFHFASTETAMPLVEKQTAGVTYMPWSEYYED